MSRREVEIRDAFMSKVASELSVRVDRLGRRGATAAQIDELKAFAREFRLIAQPERAIELRRSRTDLHTLVTGMITAIRASKKLGPTDIEVIATGVTSGRWDAAYLESIVAELLSNGLKYGGGTTVFVKLEGTRDRVRLTIEDGGAGVGTHKRTRLGARFVRGPGTKVVRGFGVGVWLVTRLVRAHGGTFRLVRARDGKGTRALVSLPRE